MKFDPKLGFQQMLDGVRARGYLRAVDNEGGCLYEGSPNGPCAVGLTMPEELRGLVRNKRMGIASMCSTYEEVGQFFGINPEISDQAWRRTYNFLSACQAAHDNLLPNDLDWEKSMEAIAAEFSDLGLVYTPPEVA